jgi:hypothetical protein
VQVDGDVEGTAVVGVIDGELEGDNDGSGEGTHETAPDGKLLIVADGATVGEVDTVYDGLDVVGHGEGAVEGLLEGPVLGVLVDIEEGENEDKLVGVADGTSVAGTEGITVGELLGKYDGDVVCSFEGVIVGYNDGNTVRH